MPQYYMLSVRLLLDQNDWLYDYAARTRRSRSAILREAVSVLIDKDRNTQARIARKKLQEQAHDTQFA
jgi:predicted transcriptional regulator